MLVNRRRLCGLTGIRSAERLQGEHAVWMASRLAGSAQARESRCTGSVAVGSRAFGEEMRSRLGCLARGRKVTEAEQEGCQLKERGSGYNAIFGAKKGDIWPENSHFWDANA